MTFASNLSSQGLKKLAQELQEYAQNTLVNKLRLFRERLAQKGINVAVSSNNGHLSQYVVFSMETSDNESVIIAKETQLLEADWLGHEGVMISPLLMTEFGSGNYAVFWESVDMGSVHQLDDGTPIGRGSFPNQKYAFDYQWFYRDKEGNKHVSRGIYPTRPMHNAVIEIIMQVEATAREVFGNG